MGWSICPDFTSRTILILLSMWSFHYFWRPRCKIFPIPSANIVLSIWQRQRSSANTYSIVGVLVLVQNIEVINIIHKQDSQENVQHLQERKILKKKLQSHNTKPISSFNQQILFITKELFTQLQFVDPQNSFTSTENQQNLLRTNYCIYSNSFLQFMCILISRAFCIQTSFEKELRSLNFFRKISKQSWNSPVQHYSGDCSLDLIFVATLLSHNRESIQEALFGSMFVSMRCAFEHPVEHNGARLTS